ncbi:MAG: CoA ester lyase [Desulfomonilaceae bacterium]
MSLKLQRSMLILPVNVQKFVEKAHARGADAIVLDLEDAVPDSEKKMSRLLVRESIEIAGRGGADVLVRINNDRSMIREDLEAAIYPGLSAIFMPKVEYPEQISELESLMGELEKARGFEVGSIKIAIHVESPLGLLNLKEIASSSKRAESISMGVDDYCLQMGVRPSEAAEELFFPLNMIAIVAHAYGTIPLGIFGSVADYNDLEKFRLSAQRAKNLGFSGAYCIHPGQLGILNEVFSPGKDEELWARRVVDCFEESARKGRASTSLDGRMVDTPIYKQALSILGTIKAIEERKDRQTVLKQRLKN